MIVKAIDVRAAGSTIEIHAKIDETGMPLEETLAVPRDQLPWLIGELAPFLDQIEDDKRVAQGNDRYHIWTPERSEEPMVCIQNTTMPTNPPAITPNGVSISFKLLPDAIAKLRALV